jgi:dihydrofolate synthase/folylpolyglutamate synthase
LTASLDALERLQARRRLGVRLGLARARGLLRELGDPQRSLRGVLVGGTNGKGSTQAMVGSVLRAAGVRVGQTPKPHLVSYRERMVVGGRAIEAAELDELLSLALAAADRIEGRYGPATEFELLTATAFLHLARSGVDVAVIEVGLGGRLDATNAWDGGVAAITNVALDHEEQLGATVVAIAREKAAIIKRGDLAVSGVSGEEGAVIERRAARLGVPLTAVAPLPVLDLSLAGLTVQHPRLGPLEVGLVGRHQAHNVAVALGILDALSEAGIATADDLALRRGLAAARWPGRLEVVESDGVTVLLDGAHNPQGASALAEALRELRPRLPAGRPTLLIAMMRDKDAAGIVAPLSGWTAASGGARVVATSVPGATRSLGAAELAAVWRSTAGSPAMAIEDPDAAMLTALRDAQGVVVVCGSLYLVGHVRGAILPGDLP